MLKIAITNTFSKKTLVLIIINEKPLINYEL